ncbi:conserved protein, unknown function [Plasmodium gaboni]|uniref:Transmembrane protein 234 n=1 Tax=Plasmodium gaboni TaxID=647221 RepID=A0A151LRP7_9APIC|nr:conserved protein, unknown function [Plasmodium gaboni]KYO01819.1 conserved protein, unknown function [Plasmodium gaboni]
MYVFLYFIIGILWGCTNAYMKKGCIYKSNDENIKKENILSIFTNYYIIVPYILNQIGSLFYYYLLSTSDISLVMPLCNTCSFFFTYVTELVIFKKELTFNSLMGFMLISLGIFICLNC